MSRDDTERRLGGFDAAGRGWVLLLLAVGGLALGVGVPYLARLAADLPWVPFQGPLQLLGSADQAWLVWLRPVLGLLAGLALGAWVILDSPVLHVGERHLRVVRRGAVQRVIPRDKVDAVFRTGSRVVVQSASGRELFAGDVEADADDVREAFLAYGYPWEGR